MSVEVLTEFPVSFVAGDTIKVTITDSDHPSSDWTLKVLLQSATGFSSFDADAGASDAFDLEIEAAESAEVEPGLYAVSYVFTETATDERETVALDLALTVYRNPEVEPTKSIARQTLEAMEAAFFKMASGSNLSFSANGHSFTKRNLKEFQQAIELQRTIVNAEIPPTSGVRSRGRILHPL
jgi:hypothetical protein